MLARDAEFGEAVKEAVVKFKDSEEFATILKEKYEASRDTSYNVKVVDIFYNIWFKHRDIDYEFLGEEFMKVKDQWAENKRLGDLNNAPTSSPLAPGTEGNVIIAEIGPSMVLEQQPPADVEEGEVVASNPPPQNCRRAHEWSDLWVDG